MVIHESNFPSNDKGDKEFGLAGMQVENTKSDPNEIKRLIEQLTAGVKTELPDIDQQWLDQRLSDAEEVAENAQNKSVEQLVAELVVIYRQSHPEQ